MQEGPGVNTTLSIAAVIVPKSNSTAADISTYLDQFHNDLCNINAACEGTPFLSIPVGAVAVRFALPEAATAAGQAAAVAAAPADADAAEAGSELRQLLSAAIKLQMHNSARSVGAAPAANTAAAADTAAATAAAAVAKAA